MIKNVVCRAVFLSLGILLFVVASYGQATQINGAASGNWSNTASWSPATVPNNGGGNTYNVTLLNSPAVTITLDINPTIDTLTLDSGSELTTDAGTTLTTTGLTNGGVVNFANGNTLTVNGATTNTNEINIAGASTANFNGNLTNSSEFLTSGKSTATVSGTFTNSNFVDLESSGDVLNVGTLTNSGEIIINAGATLNITGGGQGITTVVAGSNLIVAGTLNVINGTTTTNGLANLTTVAGNLTWENGQTLTDTPTGGTLSIVSGGELAIQNASKLVVANISNSGTFVTSGGSTATVSGTFTNNNFVELESSGDVLNAGTLTNGSTATFDVQPGATLNLTGATSSNAGAINLNSGGILEISASKVTISGTGKINLSGAGSVIEGALSTDVLTLAKGATIDGSGNIGNNLMTLNNQGTIDANVAATTLTLQMSGGTTNSGTMEATVGATLQLDAGTYTQTSTGNILASETGNALSAVNLESGVSIVGGKLTTTGTTATINLVGTNALLTLNGVSISGTGKLNLADGSTTTLLGTITNTGTVDLNSTGDTTTLFIGANPVTLSGTGKIILATNGKDVITGGSGDKLQNGNTIEGPGNIGNGMIAVTNTGTIESVAKQTGNTEIDAASATAGFSNLGTLEAVAGTTLYIDNAASQFLNFNSGTGTLTGGTYVVDGILEFDGANITTDAANITLSGSAAKIENSTNNGNALAGLNTIAAGGTFDIIGITFTTIGNFTNNGTLDVGAGSKFVVNAPNSLTNFNGATLTGGAFNVTGTLEFAGADIVNNDANITLTGTKALIESTTGANALTLFNNNESGGIFALASAAKFTTGGNFTNGGTLNVGTGSKFSVGTNGASNLTNYSSDTLTGGTYILTGTGQIQFNNEGATNGIVTNAANITLSGASGTTSSFIDQTGANMLANLATNASNGSFTLTTSRTFTTAGGFSNAGMVDLAKTTTLTIGANGSYTQTGGSTTVDGTLALATGSTGAINISGGTLFGNGGTINGAVDLTAGNVNPGDGAGLVGDIKVNGNYTQGSSGDLNIDIAGTAPNTLYSVLNIVDAASLSGTLNVTLENGFVPKVGTKFTIVDYKSLSGTFVTTNFPAVTGDHWTITYNATNAVIELVAGPGPAVVVDNVSDSTSSAAASGTAAAGTVSASPARRVTRSAGVLASTSTTHEPVAILSHVTCFAARLIGSDSCGDHSVAAAGSGLGAVHNNVMVASVGAQPGTVHNNVMPAFARPAVDTIHNNVMPASAGLASGTVHNNVMAASARPAADTIHNNVMAASTRPAAGAVHNNVMVATRSMSSARGSSSNEPSASVSALARLYACVYLPSSVARTMGCN